jgi:hypothetical protein
MSTLVVSNIVPSGSSLTVDTAQTVFDSTDSIKIPVGTTTNRPATPSAGMIRYNSQTSQFEGYGPGGAWGSLGGVMDVDQDTYISPETSAGNDDDTLNLYAAGTNIASLGQTNFNVKIAADFDSTLNVDGALTAASLNIGTGALVAGSLDISGNADIDGTMEADAYTVNGTALNEYIADTVGAMVSSNTESGISVVYQDADNTLDFDVGDFTVTLTGAVTGSGTVTNLGNVSIATTATADPTLTLAGDASGSATFTNLGNATLTVTVANDSHTHDGRYYTESESDSRFVNVTGDSMSGNLTVTGDVTATNFNTTSDASVKSDIMTIDSPLMTLSNLRGVNFDWKSSGTKSMGVVAQEVEKVLPYLVSTDSNGLKSVNYQAMVGLLIESVKDLQEQVKKLSK